LTAGALIVLVFGIVIGSGVTRFAEPERAATPPGGVAMPITAGNAPGTTTATPDGSSARTIPPEVMAGMLQAARQSLMENRYPEAIAAYQAVLKLDPRNVDAMTHHLLIVAIRGVAPPPADPVPQS